MSLGSSVLSEFQVDPTWPPIDAEAWLSEQYPRLLADCVQLIEVPPFKNPHLTSLDTDGRTTGGGFLLFDARLAAGRCTTHDKLLCLNAAGCFSIASVFQILLVHRNIRVTEFKCWQLPHGEQNPYFQR